MATNSLTIEQTNELTHSNVNQHPASRRRRTSGGVVWFCVLGILSFLGYHYFLGQADSKLTKEIRARIQALLPDFHVSLDNATLQAGESITLNGLRLHKKVDHQYREVLRAERVTCNGPLDWFGLVQGQVPIQNVVADGVQVSIWPMADGTWCLPKPTGKMKLSSQFPTVNIRSGLIRLGHEIGSS
nr:hypothetical protein [Pirellula sp.]